MKHVFHFLYPTIVKLVSLRSKLIKLKRLLSLIKELAADEPTITLNGVNIIFSKNGDLFIKCPRFLRFTYAGAFHNCSDQLVGMAAYAHNQGNNTYEEFLKIYDSRLAISTAYVDKELPAAQENSTQDSNLLKSDRPRELVQ